MAAALPSLTRLAALLALLRILRVLGLAALLLLLAGGLALLVVLLLLRITVLFSHRASPSVHSALVTHGGTTDADSRRSSGQAALIPVKLMDSLDFDV